MSIELASYLTTIFDPSSATRLMQLNDSGTFSPSNLDSNLDEILNDKDMTLPVLLHSVAIKSVLQ